MRFFLRYLFHLFLIVIISSCSKGRITIITLEPDSPRSQFGAAWLADALSDAGYQIEQTKKTSLPDKGKAIVVGELNQEMMQLVPSDVQLKEGEISGNESYLIRSGKNVLFIGGSDPSGTLYGCVELAERVKKSGRLPDEINYSDKPEMVLRGTCIGLQKTSYLPGRNVYEYPYTPENFPWFYDRELWIRYLDMLVENRMNSLFLWNGHPFASLVRLKDYPYAVEVDDETFRKNEEIFGFLTSEADKRGICVIQMFYNIIVSKPFAEHNGLKTQDRNRPIIPLIADYTRKSVAAFIEKYPNVGLMVCLGEAIATDEDDVKWFTGTIIPGVKDGLKALGRTDEPPVILRGHDTRADQVIKAALPLYKNLYTMHKYNGESLTTYEPRGQWVQIHQELGKLGPVHIANVHIMANLEPFRYGSPDFIQKCVDCMQTILGANGLHLYPQASYWDWPYTADNTSPRLLQIDRDWIWYKAWGRYAWNYKRDNAEESEYWTNQLGAFYHCGEFGSDILTAYNQTGEIAPKILRRFGISDGNRQTLLLGMFMSQLVNPYKWRVYSNFYSSNGPAGEILLEYAEREWKREPHKGETPPQIIREVVQHGKIAVEAIEKAAPHVKRNKEEFLRLKNDVHCYNIFANFFAEKVRAAMHVLRYKYSNNIDDLERAVLYLERSVDFYDRLVKLTQKSYLYANSMQTGQRRIPVSGEDGKNKTWAELLPLYKEELNNFKRNVGKLKSTGKRNNLKKMQPLKPANVVLPDNQPARFTIAENQLLYTDRDYIIKDFAGELKLLRGVRLSYEQQASEGTTIHFSCDNPVKVVVGYFNGHSYKILQPPTLETDASANDRGQADIKIANAIDIPGLYPVNIYTYAFGAGENTLQLGKGIVLILGFIDGNQDILTHDAGVGTNKDNDGIDWLFY
jgi:hypothetical protein